jgi:hypothetical protein
MEATAFTVENEDNCGGGDAIWVPVDRLSRLCNPFECYPWGGTGRISFRDVESALISLREEASLPVSWDAPVWMQAQRIAWLVKHGWSDPIDIDVAVPSLGCHVPWPVLDGNHRLAAAIFLGHKEILADVSGSLDFAEELFGVDCTGRGRKKGRQLPRPKGRSLREQARLTRESGSQSAMIAI